MEPLQIGEAHRDHVVRIVQEAEVKHRELVAAAALAHQMPGAVRVHQRRSGRSAVRTEHQHRPMVGRQRFDCDAHLEESVNVVRIDGMSYGYI